MSAKSQSAVPMALAMQRAVEELADAGETLATLAYWLVSPDPNLDGKSPCEWVASGGEPERLALAADRYAERLRH